MTDFSGKQQYLGIITKLKEAEKRNVELVEALEGITDKSNKPQFHNFLIHANDALDNINDIAIKALKKQLK